MNEYDAYYLKEPDKWSDPKKDLFILNTLKDYLKEAPGSVLDIGCGNGHTLECIEVEWPGADLYGIDLSEEAIRLAKIRLPNGLFTCSSLEDFNAFGRFDVVICSGVLEHIIDYSKAIWELNKLTGDILYLDVPNNLSYLTSEKHEGYRELRSGSHQHEWHLTRNTWEDNIKSFCSVEKYIKGPKPAYEFVWLLKGSDTSSKGENG